MTKAERIDDLLAPHLSGRADALAMIDADGTPITWDQYGAMIDQMEAALRDHGLQSGGRLLAVAENAAVLPVAIFAASRIGAWIIPVNARMSGAELARIEAHSDPDLVLYTSGISTEAGKHADDAAATPEALLSGQVHFKMLQSSLPKGEADVAVVLYTTGTTGDPKGVMLTHGNLIYAAEASAGLRKLVAEDRVYGALPLTHVFGLASMLMASTLVGATIQLAARFTPKALYEALEGGVTVLPAVPQMHALLMAFAAEHGHSTLQNRSLRYVSSGAAPLDPTWKRKAEAFYGIALQNGYGMTETTAGVSGTQHPIGHPDISVGPPLPETLVRLDETVGSEAGVGEVQVKGPQVMKGYFRAPDLTAAAITEDGYMRTGDLGCIDEEGRLHIVGRSKELIIRGGFNVYPPEVEAALNDHPQVVQSAVIGRTVEGNEEVLAFVQVGPTADVTPADLTAFVANTLSAYKRPSRIILTDVLPATATGKILKHRLLDHFAAELAQVEA